jgi:hypothetical protein
MTKTIEELTADRNRYLDAARESFERCDTDGFLSQWAHDLGAKECEAQIKILENGGKAEFWGLFDLHGNRVPAKLIQGKFGPCWALLDKPFGRFVGKFLPFCEAAGDLFAEAHHVPELDADGNPVWDDGIHGFKLDPVQTAKKQAKLEKRIANWEAKHGYRQARELAPAVAKITGSGKGLSGRAWVATFRTDGL